MRLQKKLTISGGAWSSGLDMLVKRKTNRSKFSFDRETISRLSDVGLKLSSFNISGCGEYLMFEDGLLSQIYRYREVNGMTVQFM